MKEKNIIKIILFLLIAGCISFASYNAGKSTVYSQDYEYYEKTEALLDSINKLGQFLHGYSHGNRCLL